MRKRYDYHSMKKMGGLLIVFCFAIACLGFVLLLLVPMPGKLFILLVSLSLITFLCIAYFDTVKTYIEVTDNGIVFSGWKKRVTAKWSDVRKIKMLTPFKGSYRYKVYTNNGNFTFGMVEPAEAPTWSLVDLFNGNRAKYLNELLDEIKKRAPQAKYIINIFHRPL